jgi:HK97 family phage portal protein
MIFRSMLSPKASYGDSSGLPGFLVSSSLGRRTVSGENISPARALTISTYFACVRNISEDVGKMPFELYKLQSNGGRKRALGHIARKLLRYRANKEMTARTFRELLTGWAVSWGNGYAEIERDRVGNPVALWPIHPSRMIVRRIDGEIVYDVVSSDNGSPVGAVRLAPRDVLHIRGFGDDPLCGLSVARLAVESLGLSMAAETFGASFFGNGANYGTVLEHPGKLSPDARVNLRTSWKNAYGGGAARGNDVALLEEGVKATKVTIPPEDAQFLETRTFQVHETCRWFRMPVHKVQQMDRATFTNIEQQALEYIGDCLMSWTGRWEGEAEFKLVDERDAESYQAEHEASALIRGDMAARSNYSRTMISTGVLSPNEARGLEGLPPSEEEGTDNLFLQGAMQTIERIATGPAPAPTPPGGQPPGGADGDGKDPEDATDAKKDSQQQAMALRPVFDEAEARCRRKEEMAIANARRKFPQPEAFAPWATAFYTEHAAYLIEAMIPSVTSLANSIRATIPAYRVDTAALDQVVRDYCSNAMRHVVATGAAFTPDKPLAETIIAILTLEVAHA